MSKFISLILLATITLTITACKKAPMVNSLVGSPGNCTSPVVSGTFKKGVPFNGTESVTIQVDAEVQTSHELYTDRVNGVMFSQGSTYVPARLGVQNIILRATPGTPINSGTYTFTPTLYTFPGSIGISTCTFSITFN
jgi:hypothetical protein